MPIEDVPDPVPGPRDIVLDVKACGICGSDLHGYAAGQFSALGQVMVLGGNVHRLPDEVGFDEGTFVEPLGVATHAVGGGEVERGEVAVVLGLGTIGLLVAQVLLARGVNEVIGADLSPLRRQVAEELGVAASDDLEEAIGEHQVDIVFEATGAPALVQRAMELVRPGGTVVVIALYEQRAEIDRAEGADRARECDLHAGGVREALGLPPGRSSRIAMRWRDLGEAFEVQLDKDAAIKVMVSPPRSSTISSRTRSAPTSGPTSSCSATSTTSS